MDTSKIEGYADMTAEQKLAALEAYEPEVIPTESPEVEKLKRTISKINSEAADYKKQLRERQTEAERAEAEAAEQRKMMEEQIKVLTEEKQLSQYKSAYISMGYTPEQAGKKAEAMLHGDMDMVFAIEKEFNQKQKEAIEAASMNHQPKLTGGEPLTQEMIQEQEQKKLRKYFGLT